MNIYFESKVVLVTGASKGIGRAAAIAFVQHGATVYALSRTRNQLESLVEEYPTIRPIVCDLTDVENTDRLIQRIGQINIVINAAQIMKNEELLGEILEFDEVVKTNVRGPLQISQIAIRTMMEKRDKEGAIVNVSSICSTLGTEKLGVYSATKAALDSLTRTLAVEHGRHGIRINSVNVGLLKSEVSDHPRNKDRMNYYLQRVPLDISRCIDVDDVVNVILFLASSKAAGVTGQCIPVDGGYSIHGL